MDDWLHPEGNRQPQGWVIPESLLTRVAEPVAGAADEQPPADRLPDYSQPASYANSTHSPSSRAVATPARRSLLRPPAISRTARLPATRSRAATCPVDPACRRGCPGNRSAGAAGPRWWLPFAGGLVLSLLVLAVVLGALQRAGYLDTSDEPG